MSNMEYYQEQIKIMTEGCAKMLAKINDNYMSGLVSYAETIRQEEEWIMLMTGMVVVAVGAMYAEMEEEAERKEEEKRTRMEVQKQERLLRMRTRHRIRLERIRDGEPGKHFTGQDMCSVKQASTRPTSPTVAICSRKPSVRRRLFT